MVESLAQRHWIPDIAEQRLRPIVERTMASSCEQRSKRLTELTERNTAIHDRECVNLNPATNTMSPAAAAALSAGLSSRTSLGYPGAKYEMGLEAIEEIEVMTAQLAAAVFDASFVEFRVPSGAMANLMVFMATARPGDAVIVPPATVAGHVTHHQPGAAGLYGLEVHEAPIDAYHYTLDVAGVAELAARVRPALITVGSSLNLCHHDVEGLRGVADEVGATLMFDAAHLSGLIAGGAWPNPLAIAGAGAGAGAHVMTMSTYKSLAGPTAGLVVTNEPALAERIEAIAFPGLTANFDVGKTAALGHTLNDWLQFGQAYAAEMVACARSLAAGLAAAGVAVHRADGTATASHAFAIDARSLGGGAGVARRLRAANLLASAIGLPSGLDGGVRVGTNELVRWGATTDDMAPLAALIARALESDDVDNLAAVAAEVGDFRRRLDRIHYATESA